MFSNFLYMSLYIIRGFSVSIPNNGHCKGHLYLHPYIFTVTSAFIKSPYFGQSC